MREILIRKSPKVVISGRSQTGKSTLFKYLTGRNLDELRNIDAFNTRMSLQCPTLIKFNNNKDNKDESGLVIDVVDNPGQDDATRQAKNLLDMTLHSASLFIVVTTLADVNQKHTIDFIDKLLRDTQVNILILINQVDIRLFEEWEKFKNKSSNNDESNNYDWEQIEETAIHNTTESRSDFNACDTVKKLIERPKRELMNGLKTDQVQIDNRVTVKSIILKDFPKSSMACIHLQSFAQREEHFLSQVSKSYVNTWIIENLTKPAV
jgi:small GTP-binding protein